MVAGAQSGVSVICHDNQPESERTTIDFAKPEQLVGQCLEGRFFIEKNLSANGADPGGIGVVFLASDQKMLGRQVVVKVLNEEALKVNDIVRKFLHEKEALVRLDHPGVVKILDSGVLADGNPFIVMEYIEGQSLRKALQRQKILPLHLAAHLIYSIADALAAAHSKNVLHRDVKPENIMLTEVEGDYDRLRLIDFGIAKVGNSKLAPETEISRAIGTVLYIAPEQLIGINDIKPAADIYSLAIVAFEILTGDLPFKPKTPVEMYRLQQEGVKVTPRRLRPDIPPRAEEILLSALAFDPSDRPQNARAFGRDLSKALTNDNAAKPISIRDDDFLHSIQTEYFPSIELKSGEGGVVLPPTEVIRDNPIVNKDRPMTRGGRNRLMIWGGIGALVLIIVLASAVGTFLYLSPIEGTKSAPAENPVPTKSYDVEINYFLMVQKMRNGKAYDTPYPSVGKDMYFDSSYEYVVNMQADKAGHFYAFNEGPDDAGRPVYTQLFPTPLNKLNGRAEAGQLVKSPGNGFRQGKGSEINWVIWTRERLDELEAIIRTAKPPFGLLTPEGAARLKIFLDQHKNNPRDFPSTNEEKVVLRASGDIVVDSFELKHR